MIVIITNFFFVMVSLTFWGEFGLWGMGHLVLIIGVLLALSLRQSQKRVMSKDITQ
jgi:hypothetical protein